MTAIRNFRQNFKKAFSGYTKHKVFTLSASLSFFTIFTIGPMMLVMIFIAGLFLGRYAAEGAIINQVSDIVGDASAQRIQELIKNASVGSNNIMAILGIAILMFAATAIFTDMQSSMNIIWNLKLKPGNKFLHNLKDRLISFLIVSGFGLLLVLMLFASGLLNGFMNQLHETFPQVPVRLIYLMDLALTFIIVTLLFAFVFKVLPDAVIKWKDVKSGAILSAILFMAGSFALSLFIKNSNTGNAYGSARSLVILLVWIFYSANVLYLGAEYSKAYFLRNNPKIEPKDFAESTRSAE